MPAVKIIEIIGISSESFEDAIKEGLKRASETVEGITGIDVIGQKASVKDGRITEYRVNMKMAFLVK